MMKREFYLYEKKYFLQKAYGGECKEKQGDSILQILSRSNLEIASALNLGEGRKQVEAWGRESGGIPIAGISLTKQKEEKEGNTENDLTPTV